MNKQRQKLVEKNIYALYSTKKGSENVISSYKVEVKVNTNQGRKSINESFKVGDYTNQVYALAAAVEFRDSVKEDQGRSYLEKMAQSETVISSKVGMLFERSLPMLTNGTRKLHQSIFSSYISPYKDKDIQDILGSDINDSVIAGSDSSYSWQQRIVATWRSIYAQAVKDGFDVKDLTIDYQLPRREEVDVDETKYAVVSQEDFDFFVETLNGYGQDTEEKNYERKIFNYMVHFALYTGCRPSELTAWSKNCIVFDDENRVAKIHVNKAVGSTHSKKLTLVQPKNKTSDRWVWVKGENYDLLKEAVAFSKNEIIFANMDGTLMESSYVANHIGLINKKCKKQGRDFKFSLYGLRKTFATRMAQSREPFIPPEVLMRMMGHSNINTTYKYYVQLRNHTTEEAFLNAAWN